MEKRSQTLKKVEPNTIDRSSSLNLYPRWKLMEVGSGAPEHTRCSRHGRGPLGLGARAIYFGGTCYHKV